MKIKIPMKTMLKIIHSPSSILIGLLLCSSESGLIAQQNIVQNSSFEGGWQNGPVGWGWTYNIGLFGATPSAANGGFWADVYGTIYQDLQTLPGQQYHLRFALAGNFNISAPQVLNVLWDGVGEGNASWNPAGHNINNLGWVWSDFDLIATDSSTRLTFDNPYVGDGSGRIARIDAISVTVVPEPSGLLFIGLGTLVLWKRR
jgi:hypothetical protein